MLYIKRLDAVKWIKGILQEAALLRATPPELTLSCGIHFHYDAVGWGLGDFDLALLETQSGLPFGLARARQSVRKNHTMIIVDERLQDVTTIVNEIMCNLKLKSSDMIWFSPERYQFRPCTLFRVDDNGNHLVMQEYDCYPRCLVQSAEVREKGPQTGLLHPGRRAQAPRMDRLMAWRSVKSF